MITLKYLIVVNCDYRNLGPLPEPYASCINKNMETMNECVVLHRWRRMLNSREFGIAFFHIILTFVNPTWRPGNEYAQFSKLSI